MKRVFGKKKETGPAPSLSEAGGRVDERVAKIDEKVRQAVGAAVLSFRLPPSSFLLENFAFCRVHQMMCTAVAAALILLHMPYSSSTIRSYVASRVSLLCPFRLHCCCTGVLSWSSSVTFARCGNYQMGFFRTKNCSLTRVFVLLRVYAF